MQDCVSSGGETSMASPSQVRTGSVGMEKLRDPAALRSSQLLAPLDAPLCSQKSSIIHVGAWSLAFFCPRTHRSTPPSTSRTDKFGESRK
jgi:hypothetical protein